MYFQLSEPQSVKLTLTNSIDDGVIDDFAVMPNGNIVTVSNIRSVKILNQDSNELICELPNQSLSVAVLKNGFLALIHIDGSLK